jgi:ankyrin repeat protein/tetratricopeptide (TPR) repeat protein
VIISFPSKHWGIDQFRGKAYSLFEFPRVKKLILIIVLSCLAMCAGVVAFLGFHDHPDRTDPLTEKEIIQWVASGRQDKAEEEVARELKVRPGSVQVMFWQGVLSRSRFYGQGSIKWFVRVMKARPKSPMGLASACVVGIDLSRTSASALHYFNALLILASEHPDSIPIQWMTAVMARTLTRYESPPERPYTLPKTINEQVLLCGVEHYRKTLELMAPGPGPVLIHQTFANLLDDLKDHEQALKERDLALAMERRPWSTHAASMSHVHLGQYEPALPLISEAIEEEEKDLRKILFLRPVLRAATAVANALSGISPRAKVAAVELTKLRNSLTCPPELSNYYSIKGFVLWNLGKKEEALATLQKGLALNPGYAPLLRDCQYYSWCLGKYPESLRYAREMLLADPKNRRLNIIEARLAVLSGEPGATNRIKDVGCFDFKGNPITLRGLPRDPWFRAATCGDADTIRRLIPKVDINTRDREYPNQTALMKAAQSGWEPIVIDLLKAGAKTDLADSNGDTALHYSVQFKQPRMVVLLLDAGANASLRDKWQQTALSMATDESVREMAKQILEKKPDVNVSLPGRGSALHEAAEWGKVETVHRLIACGADVNRHSDTSGNTPLMMAAQWHHISVMKELLGAGANPNAVNKKGETVLFQSVQPGVDLPMVLLLLDRGADPSIATGSSGMTAVTKARLLGYEDLARRMEAKSVHAKPFVFPALPPPEAAAGGVDTSLFILPLRMVNGNFPGNFPPSKEDTVTHLSSDFGITNRADMQRALSALDSSASLQMEAGRLSLNSRYEEVQNLLTSAVWTIHDTCTRNTNDDAAWNSSRMIYLARLGLAAGFLSKSEAEARIVEASKILIGRFASWSQFFESLQLGVRYHEEWDVARYAAICGLLNGLGLPWPPVRETTPATASPTPAATPTPSVTPSPAVSPVPTASPISAATSTPTPIPPQASGAGH